MEENNIDRLKLIIENKKKSKIKKFGISFAIGMFLLSVILFIKGVDYRIISIPLTLFLFHIVFSFVNTAIVYPSFVVISFVGKTIGNLLTGLVFWVVFYLFITPIAVLLRIFKKDHIINNYKITSWLKVEENFNDAKRIEKLF